MCWQCKDKIVKTLRYCYLYYKNEKSLSILASPVKSENTPAAITEQTHPKNTGTL